MPDMERLTDKLMLDLAVTPEQRGYAKGYIAGKSRARREVAILTALLPGMALLVLAIVAAQRLFNL